MTNMNFIEFLSRLSSPKALALLYAHSKNGERKISKEATAVKYFGKSLKLKTSPLNITIPETMFLASMTDLIEKRIDQISEDFDANKVKSETLSHYVGLFIARSKMIGSDDNNKLRKLREQIADITIARHAQKATQLEQEIADKKRQLFLLRGGR